MADAGDTTRGLLASARGTRRLTRAGNTADGAETNRLTDQGHTGGWLTDAGL